MNIASLLTCLYTFFSLSSLANIMVNPVMIEFSDKELSQEISVENQSNSDKIFQASVKEWLQDSNGESVYKDTKKIIVFPLMAKIPAKSTQKFRIIFKKSADSMPQMSYRLFLEEVKNRAAAKSNAAMFSFLFKILIPVFINSDNLETKLDKKFEIIKSKNNYQVTLKNNGNKYIKIKDLTIKNVPNFKIKEWQYILPFSQRVWNIPIKKKIKDSELSLSYSLIENGEEKTEQTKVSLIKDNYAKKPIKELKK